MPRFDLSLWARMWRLSFRRQCLVGVAVLLLCWATFCVRLLPFRRMAVGLGLRGHVASAPLTDEQLNIAKEWAWALNAVARRLPWTATCLMQALACQYGLRRYRVPATVYLGVAAGQPDEGGRCLFDAHAWLCCGDHILTGAQEAARFKPIACFGSRWD